MRSSLLTGIAIGCAAIMGAWIIAQFIPLPRVQPEPTQSLSNAPAHGTQPWNDPSIDPKTLERTFALPSEPLPPEARPTPSAIQPSQQAWRKLQQKGAIANHPFKSAQSPN